MIYRTYTKKKHPFELIAILIIVLVPTIVVLMMSVAHGQGYAFIMFLPLVGIGAYWLRQEGVVLDLEHQRYRKFTYYLFMEFGHWERLPEITRMVLKHSNDFVNTSSKFNWTSTGYRKMHYKIALQNPSINFQLEILNTEEEEEAYDLARELEEVLGVKMVEMKLN